MSMRRWSAGFNHYLASTRTPIVPFSRIETRFGRIPIKVSEGAYGPAIAKPEFDACVAAARNANASVREVLEAAVSAYQALR